METKRYDAIVIGCGHAGVEASLALARLGHKTLAVTLSLDAIAFMACNPAIGGTAKGHLVREIDALGGQMGLSADNNLLQIRMLNMGKGAAVQSLRGQADKTLYHHYMKNIMETQPNLDILQAEVAEVLTSNGKVIGVKTTLGQEFYCDAIVVCTGVYLNAHIIIGDNVTKTGPNGFSRATKLTDSLLAMDIPTRRFKTGTPARVDKNSINFEAMQVQNGDDDIYPFSFMTKGFVQNKEVCYLTYTTQKTKDVILANIDRSPLYNGSIHSVGPRYCPSIEDKIMRFADKERHQIFIEPESSLTNEMYVQGMSSSLPYDVQIEMYKSVIGLEKVKIMRFAYAIEYDCIDSLCLTPYLMVKHIGGLFLAGQLNGSSGYEEAAAQGLIAGINASLYLKNKAPLTLTRDSSYIGVLIDDLVTKGTNEPYRMMTARAEHRLLLRQENADKRLTPIGREVGLVDDKRWESYCEKLENSKNILALLDKVIPPKDFKELFESIGESIPHNGLSFRDMLKRPNVTCDCLIDNFDDFKDADRRCFEEIATDIKYEGYLCKQKNIVDDINKLESKSLPNDIDYSQIKGLRIEARQKLDKIRPLNLGQASRISGVSPADITVLLVYLSKNKL
ncbi:MAG: tRNA uridine-5-carboxymethylaminomethyl(34) synthesis enzyme MnmG [Clostridia bacterium]|nr:tRNA uridine-5-carboxymethylaminomethyl(34) synthesis enzyme MnmG [Clostridia bacterium]MDE7328596.1 tRNA uridine-5-carboxymethylaminomethyl(34) synthesis enzyme MnmG [Clostridia bacterium]